MSQRRVLAVCTPKSKLIEHVPQLNPKPKLGVKPPCHAASSDVTEAGIAQALPQPLPPCVQVNHVFDILLHYANHADWTAALVAAMPQRCDGRVGWVGWIELGWWGGVG